MGEGRYRNKDSVGPEGERKNDRRDIYYRTQPRGGDTGIKTVQGPRERERTTEKIYILSHTTKGGRYRNKDSAGPKRERGRTTEKIYIIAYNQGGRGDTRKKTVQGLKERGRTTEKIYIIAHNQRGKIQE